MKFCELGVVEVFYRFDETGVGGSVLDIGAGAGDIVRALRDADIQAEGCEFSSSGRKLAMERFKELVELKNIQNPEEMNDFIRGLKQSALQRQLTEEARIFLTLPRKLKREEILRRKED